MTGILIYAFSTGNFSQEGSQLLGYVLGHRITG